MINVSSNPLNLIILFSILIFCLFGFLSLFKFISMKRKGICNGLSLSENQRSHYLYQLNRGKTSGFIVKKEKRNAAKFLFSKNKFWVIKSHDKSEFISKDLLSSEDFDKAIKKHLANGEFWIQPYISADFYGKILSHSKENFSDFELNVNQKTLLPRYKSYEGWKSILIEKILFLEKKYGKAFSLTFCVKNKKLIIIDVKEQDISFFGDKLRLQAAREIEYKNIEPYHKISNMGSSLLFYLVGKDLFYTQKYFVSNLKQGKERISIDLAYSKIMKIKQKKEYNHMEISVLLMNLKKIFCELKNYRIESSENHMDIISSINNSMYNLSTNIDICSKERLYFDNIIDSNSSNERVFHFLLYVAVNLVREKIIINEIKFNNVHFDIKSLEDLSIASYIQGKRP